ncbi:MAG: nitroreductase family protein [Anaerolineae bacterium]|nr:nitroreductase family protein [Anaerolineae bacterium]
MHNEAAFTPLAFERLPPAEQLAQSRAFLARMRSRRSVRQFSTEPVPLELIENAVATAATAPSGANQQPWTFVVVAVPALKQQIRAAAEAEERESYEHRMSEEWKAALAPLGTDWHKPHLEDAPYLIVVFQQVYGLEADADGQPRKIKHYYTTESVGIAVGLLLASLHLAGLATLTHTPSPMGFLSDVLERPPNERAYVVIPVGYPAADAQVPVIARKPLRDVLIVRTGGG